MQIGQWFCNFCALGGRFPSLVIVMVLFLSLEELLSVWGTLVTFAIKTVVGAGLIHHHASEMHQGLFGDRTGQNDGWAALSGYIQGVRDFAEIRPQNTIERG